ncbi:MAG: hypothetical protein K0R24_2125, partial [Gammaproteobacteria bacterium]|nr:hypothetical protein [Gammaproteobacteria bacterium]
MSMSHAFNDVFNDKKKARQWYQKATQAAGTQDYQELEASVYWHVLEQKLKGNPLLAAFKTVLAPGGTVTSEQLDDCTREDKLSEAENAPELLQLTNGLIGFAHYKNLDKRNARLRFIAGILEACYIIFNANDADKVNHWHTLKDILESVKDSHLSDTRAIPDQARSIVGLSESLTHYKTQLVAAVRTAEQIILKEQVIQTKQAIKDDLKNLNSAMKQIPALLPRFIYNVYSDAPVMTLDYHFLYLDQSEHIISLVTVGIQQIIGLPNPTYNLCYEHGKLNERGTKIHALNHILQLLGGKNEVKMNGLAPELPRAEESVLFLRTLREMAQDERLVLSSDGNMVLFARPEAGGNRREICRFPSGFSPEILHTDEEKNCPNDAQKRRQEVVLDYIELLTLTQELQHCFQLNQQYAHYLSQVGELGAFAMMDSTLHEQMELHNKEVAHVLQTKMEEILTDFAVPVEGALGAHTLSKGSDESRRRQAIQEARKIIQNTKRKVATISQQSDAIIRKRKETMQQMKDNKISFYKSLQELLHHYHEFRRLQNLLGRKEVPALSSDAICDMNDKAKKLDDSIRPSSLPTTPMTASHDSEEKEKKEECELAPPYLSPLWTYPPAERKWQYRGFFQFKTARQRLRYYKNDQREAEEKYDPAALLRAYLPQTASKAQKQTESSFGYQIRLRYDVATALKN